MKTNYNLNIWFVLGTLVMAVIIVPVIFNFFFLWDSRGWANGETSDWFVLYGNIIGGLLGGFFTYLALLLTFNEQKKSKKNDMRPKLDIPYQSIEFISTEKYTNTEQIGIEFNNIGGSMAKNIKCILSITNYDEVINELEKNKSLLNIDFIKNPKPGSTRAKESVYLILVDDFGKQKAALGSVLNYEYQPQFIGTCLPLSLNYKANNYFILQKNIGDFINFVVQKRNYSGRNGPNKKELFKFDLDVAYSSDEYGDFEDKFSFEWEFIGMLGDEGVTTYKYLLKSKKVGIVV